MTTDPSKLPWLGAGLGYREEIHDFLLGAPGLGFVELMPEHVLDGGPRFADRFSAFQGRPMVTHSVSASVGSAEGPNEAFLREMRRISDDVGAPWASDHLCFTRAGGRDLGQLVPVPYTDESLDVLVRNVRTAQRILGRPFALENITRYFTYRDETYTEPEFLRRLCDETGAFVLLDVTNVWNNAQNVGLDPARYLAEFPLDRVVHLHIAGVHPDGDHVLDTHAAPVPEPVWAMTERVLEEAPVRALVLERDDGFDDLPGLAAELARAADLMEDAR